MRWLQVIFTHAVFISLCAAGLAWQTNILLQAPVEPFLIALVFLSTFCSYNVYRLISIFPFSKPHDYRSFCINQAPVFIFLSIAAVWIIYIITLFPAAMIHVFSGTLLAIIYSLPLWPGPLKKIAVRAGFVKTILLAFTWTYISISIPLLQSPFTFSMDQWFLFATRFFFMLILCIMFDARDIEVDKMKSFSSLATGMRGNMLHMVSMFVFVLFLSAAYLFCRDIFGAGQFFAFLATGIATCMLYLLSLKKRGYFFYYFLVDGLMLFSTLASYVATI